MTSLNHEAIEAKFTTIYKENRWGSKESVSGPGSTKRSTASLKVSLREAFKTLGIKSLVDAPCGDGIWIRDATDDLERYQGFDIVKDLMSITQEALGDQRHSYAYADITRDLLPTADAILCRDCLFHLTLEGAQKALSLFRQSKAKYLFSTTFAGLTENKEGRVGGFRHISLEIAPFDLGKPKMLILDRRGTKSRLEKNIGVWELN